MYCDKPGITSDDWVHIYAFENEDRKGRSWKPYTIYTGDEHQDGACVVDIDNDGDLDIISIGWGHSRVLLFENKTIVKRL